MPRGSANWIGNSPPTLIHLRELASQEKGRQHCCVAEQSAPRVAGSVHVAPGAEDTEVDATAECEADRGKIAAAEVQGQTVMVDSTVTVFQEEAARAKREAGRTTVEKSILLAGTLDVGTCGGRFSFSMLRRGRLKSVVVMLEGVTGADGIDRNDQ